MLQDAAIAAVRADGGVTTITPSQAEHATGAGVATAQAGAVCERPTCGKPRSGYRPWQRFCSPVCRRLAWDALNPRIKRPAALPGRKGRSVDEVFGLLADGSWRTVREIAAYVQLGETSASARLRDLRKKRYGAFRVDRRRRAESREFEYQLVLR